MRTRITSLPLYIVYILILIILLSKKANLHEDELFTYGLSNNPFDNSIEVDFEDGVKYSPGSSAFSNYVTVDNTHPFNYKEVWTNQKNDVHPPFYYAVIHTICSLFPEHFSIWYPGIVNIVFACLTLFILRKIMDNLKTTKESKCILSVLFLFQTGMWDTVSFLRMYMMVIFWAILLTYLLITYVDLPQYSIKQLLTLGAILICGSLTHYYFIPYSFFLCLFFCIYLIIYKNYTAIFQFFITAIVAGFASIAIFPPIIHHIFLEKGDRGEQSINNLLNSSFDKYFSQIKIFIELMDAKITGGGLLLWFIIALLFFSFFYITKNQPSITTKNKTKWLLLTLPSLCYFFLICKIAVMNTDRYTSLIYPNIFLALYLGGSKLLHHYLKDKVYRFIMIIFVIVISMNQIRSFNGTYLFTDSKEFLLDTEEYKDKDCICLYSSRWKLHPAFYELKNYQSVTFYPYSDIVAGDTFPKELAHNKDYILCLTDDYDREEVINFLKKIDSEMKNCNKLGGYRYTETYYIMR